MAARETLVIYRKQLGDLLLLQPALTRLAESTPVAVHARAGCSDLLSLMPGNIRPAPDALFPRAATVLCLEDRPAAFFTAARALGARKRLLLTRPSAYAWARLFFHDIVVRPGLGDYQAHVHQRLLCGLDSGFTAPQLTPPPASWRPAGLPTRYAVLHPTAAWQRKTWPAERWVELLSHLGSNLPWVITAGSAAWEVALAARIADTLATRLRIHNLAGQTSLRGYLATLAGACATFCVDGSASHLSAAFGHPTLTLFGPTRATRWHRPGPHRLCLEASNFSPQSKPPVDAIPVRAVLPAARAILEAAA